VLYFHCKFHGRDQQKRLTDAELELAAAKSKGYVSKYGVSSNGTATGHRLHAVVGVMTNFGSRSRREAIRKNLLPSGTTLQELEDNKGIVIRFVIGRSANGGDMSDKQIDRENSDTNDFLILVPAEKLWDEFLLCSYKSSISLCRIMSLLLHFDGH
jgi:hypothetical protein